MKLLLSNRIVSFDCCVYIYKYIIEDDRKMTEQNENARLKIISSYSIRVIYARYVTL